MAEGGPNLVATLTLKDLMDPALKANEAKTKSWAQRMSASISGIGKSIFSLKNLMAGGIVGFGFSKLVNSSEELREKWGAWKKDVMDSGPTDSMIRLGDAISDIAKNLSGSADSASTLGGFLSDVIEVGTTMAIGLQGFIDILKVAYYKTGELGNKAIAGFGPAAALASAVGYDAKKRADEFGQSWGTLVENIQAGVGPAQEMRTKLDALKVAQEDLRKAMEVQKKKREEQETNAKSEKGQLAQAKAESDAHKARMAQLAEAIAKRDAYLDKQRASYEFEKKEKELVEQYAEEDKAKSQAAANLANYTNMKKGEAEYVKQLEKADAITGRIRETWNEIVDAARQVWSVMTETVIKVFDDWIDGQLKPARDYIKDIARELGNMAIRAGMQMAFSLATTAATSAFAGGGVVRGGVGVPSAASGMIARGPQLIQVGDNLEREEAIIPMRGGKVPVSLSGGGRGTSIYVQALDSKSFAQSLRDKREAVAMVNRLNFDVNPAMAGGY